MARFKLTTEKLFDTRPSNERSRRHNVAQQTDIEDHLPSFTPRDFLERLTGTIQRYARRAVFLAITGSGLMAWYAATHLAVNTDTANMFALDLGWFQAFQAYRSGFHALDSNVLIVLDAPLPERADRAQRELANSLVQDGSPALIYILSPAFTSGGENTPKLFSLKFGHRHVKTIRLISAAIGAVCLWLASNAYFDSNPLNLRDPDSESVRTYRELLADPDTAL